MCPAHLVLEHIRSIQWKMKMMTLVIQNNTDEVNFCLCYVSNNFCVCVNAEMTSAVEFCDRLGIF